MTISPKTTVETGLLQLFSDLKHKDTLSSTTNSSRFLPSLAQRQEAIQKLETYGLPTRKKENWHYTDLRRLFSNMPGLVEASSDGTLQPLLEAAQVLTLNNGIPQPAVKPNAKGVVVETLIESKKTEDSFHVLDLEAKKNQDNSDVVNDINTAFSHDGWHIDVNDNGQAMHYIEVQNIQKGGQSHSRFPVHIGKNAHVTLIERQTGDDQESFLTFVSEIALSKGAQVNWIILRDRGLSATELNRFEALLEEDANLTLHIVNAGGKLLRQEVNVDLVGENANFQLRGINLLSNKSHTDTTMVVRHLVENTTSTEVLRNVVTEEAQGVFQGMIKVAQIAQKTDAKMACNSLILSDDAAFNAKPELEIFADDVACGHGATVAEIDHDHLFYLMARGIPEGEARSLLVKAFVNELIEELPEELADTLHEMLENWLKKHFYA